MPIDDISKMIELLGHPSIFKPQPIPSDPRLDEDSFLRWYRSIAQQRGYSADPDDSSHFYDYRSAYRSGAQPDINGHWPSAFKKEGHPNLVVGGFNTKTGERVHGYRKAKSVDELVRLGWDRDTAIRLMGQPDE